MASTLTHLAIRWRELSDPYDAFEATGAAERAACYELVERVRRLELRRAVDAPALISAAFGEARAEPRVLAVRHRRSGRIVGCALGTPASAVFEEPRARAEYRLDRIDPSLIAKVGIATRFVVEPEHRRTLAGLALLKFYTQQGMAEGFELCLFSCEPGLVPLYTGLGMRPIGACHPSPLGGFRLPMALICHDRAHLVRLGSPLLAAIPASSVRPDSPFLAWYRDVILGDGPVDTRLRPYEGASHGAEPPVDDCLTHGMSGAGRRALLRGALVIRCRPGDVVVREGDGGRQLGVVIEGALIVRRGEVEVARLTSGAPFGELGWALSTPRTAGLTAADEASLLLLSARAPERLSEARDREALWRNLARVLGERLVAMTGERAERLGSGDQA